MIALDVLAQGAGLADRRGISASSRRSADRGRQACRAGFQSSSGQIAGQKVAGQAPAANPAGPRRRAGSWITGLCVRPSTAFRTPCSGATHVASPMAKRLRRLAPGTAREPSQLTVLLQHLRAIEPYRCTRPGCPPRARLPPACCPGRPPPRPSPGKPFSLAQAAAAPPGRSQSRITPSGAAELGVGVVGALAHGHHQVGLPRRAG